WKAPGRTRFNVAPEAGAVVGMRFVEFDGAQAGVVDPLVVAQVGTTLRSASFAAETGTFADLATGVGSSAFLDSIHYNNHFFLLSANSDGVANRVIFLDPAAGTPTSRRHGMAPVTANVTLASAAGAGWPTNFAEFGDGRYFFFLTEVDKNSDAYEIEGTYTGG